MKKVFGILLLIIMLFPISVFAKEIELLSIKPVYDESSGIVLNDSSSNSFDVTFNAADQEIKFEAVIKNTTDKDIIVDSINVTSPTYNFMSYKVTGLDLKDVIKSQEEKNITLVIKSEHSTDILQNFEDRIIVDVNGKYREIIPILDNPATGVFTFIVLIPVWIIGTAIILLIKKKSNKSLFKMNMVLLIMVSVLTVTRISALQVFNIKINGKVDYKSKLILMPKYKDCEMIEQERSDYYSYVYKYNDLYNSYSDGNLFFSKGYYILNLYIRGDGQVPEEYDESGDISQAQDGSIMIYLKKAMEGTAKYSWNDNTYDYVYYDAYIVADGKIYFPENANFYFENLKIINKFEGIENTGTDYTKYMYGMFSRMANNDVLGEDHESDIHLDLSHWNLSNVKTMAYMFSDTFDEGCYVSNGNLYINLEGTDTSNVLDMHDMFYHTGSGTIFGTAPDGGYQLDVELHMNNINVENVKDFRYMFYGFMRGASHPRLEIKGWTLNSTPHSMFNAIGVKSPNKVNITIEDFTLNAGAEGMFRNAAGHSNPGGVYYTVKNLKIVGSAKEMFYSAIYQSNNDDNQLNIENWDTSEVTDMSKMFSNVDVKVLDLSSFDTSNVTNMDQMFNTNKALETIYVSDKWNMDKVESAKNVSYGNPLFNSLYDTINDFNPQDYRPYFNTSCSGILTDINNPKNCTIQRRIIG